MIEGLLDGVVAGGGGVTGPGGGGVTGPGGGGVTGAGGRGVTSAGGGLCLRNRVSAHLVANAVTKAMTAASPILGHRQSCALRYMTFTSMVLCPKRVSTGACGAAFS